MDILKFIFSKRFLLIFVVVLLLGIGGYFFYQSRYGGNKVTAKVGRGTVKEELILTGTAKAEKYATLSFPTAGKIAFVGVTEGQEVKKGQAIASLDKTVLNTSYMQALNDYRNYQAAAENALDSVKNHSNDETYAQKETRTTAEVNRDNAYDAVTAARYALNNATLFAPFAGTVSSLPHPNVGLNVLATDIIAEIVDPVSIYFEVDADQSEVTNVKVGQEVTVILDSLENLKLEGRVSYIGITPKMNETGTIYRVKVVFSGEKLDPAIKVGMTGDARFLISQKEDVLYAPIDFVNSDKDGSFVYLGRPNNKVRVETGIEGEEVVEIKSGVNEGDTLYD